MSSTPRARPVVVLGGGLAGLSAGAELGADALVLEADSRPGGLARTERIGDYWFDRVIHLLYFPDAATEAAVRRLPGHHLTRCPPAAWVETARGTARFPLQEHLGHLDHDAAQACLRDFELATEGHDAGLPPGNYEEMLRRAFGEALCDLFFLPYNRKVWRRPLAQLAGNGFQWNIARPALARVVQGVNEPDAESGSYNADGWYPRPPPEAPVRGMETIAQGLSSKVPGMRLRRRVTGIDLERRSIETDGGERFEFDDACVSTLPLPVTVALCRQAPAKLVRACSALRHNRVISVALCLDGPRPRKGHWRYYTDESVVFTRLVYMHEFDPLLAPRNGWGLLAEVTDRAERRPPDPTHLIERVWKDVQRVGGAPEGSRLVEARAWTVDPAYVVFGLGHEQIVSEARGWLAEHGVQTLGRYGRWEYSSMGQVMRDGALLGRQLASSSRALSGL